MSSPTIRHPSTKALIAFNAGKLDDSNAAAVNKHLKNCPECRRQLYKLSGDSTLPVLPLAEPTSDAKIATLAAAVDAARTQPPPLPDKSSPSRRHLWLIAAGGAAGVAVALIGVAIAWISGVFETRSKAPVTTVAKTESPTPEASRAGASPRVIPVNEQKSTPPATKTSNSSDGTAAPASPPAVPPAGVDGLAKKQVPAVVENTAPPSAVASNAMKTQPTLEPPVTATKMPPPANNSSELFFNGKDLAGWEGARETWRVENGSIIGVAPPTAGKQAVFLCRQRQYKDFDLRFQAAIEGGVGDCGLQFRSQRLDAGQVQVTGPQCAIYGKDAPKGHWTGYLLTEPPFVATKTLPAKLIDRFIKPTENHFHVRCQGKHVLIEVNGIKTFNADVPTLPEDGVIAWKLDAKRPPHKVTFKITKFTDLSDQPTRSAPEQPTLADAELLKAEIKFEKAMKLADENLYKHFDGEISSLEHRPKERQLIGAVQREKELFKEKGLIPWSHPMRKWLVAYAKELATARRLVGIAFDTAIDRAEKSQDEQRKEALIKEAGRVLAPRPVGAWQWQGPQRMRRLEFYSDGTYVADNKADESGSRFWEINEKIDKVVLQLPGKDPTITLSWVYELTPDGQTMIAQRKNGSKFSWQHVED